MTITLNFEHGELVSLDATLPWHADYNLHGLYELSTTEGPGFYTVFNGDDPDWRTSVVNAQGNSVYSANELLLFTDPPIGGAVPEISTWAMLALGFAFMAKMVLDKRAKRAAACIDSLGPPN